MKIRTPEQLSDALASDLIWRKKELTSYRLALVPGLFPERRDGLLRGALALLYAHWEGYTKFAANSYLECVAAQRLRNHELSPAILAVAIRPLLRAASDGNRIAAHRKVIEFLFTRMTERSSVPYKDAIATRANLSSRVLREILETLGLDYSPFEAKATLLDEGLLERRNTIAHGEFLTLTLERYLELSEEVLAMMEQITTQIANAAATGLYRRAA
jgi:hypothetical protein